MVIFDVVFNNPFKILYIFGVKIKKKKEKKKQIMDGFFRDDFKNRLELNFYRRFFENVCKKINYDGFNKTVCKNNSISLIEILYDHL
jgi:hypothetical protein